MKFKPITPGMVIHCPKEEDARALLEYLDELGYRWNQGGCLKETHYAEGDTYYLNCEPGGMYPLNVTQGYHENATARGIKITEFSNLIEPDIGDPRHQPMTADEFEQWLCERKNTSCVKNTENSPMSAVEVLEWLFKNYESGAFKEAFGEDYVFDDLGHEYEDNVGEIIDKITAYEAVKKTPKPVEFEWGYRCCIYYTPLEHDKFDMFGVTEGEAENEVRKRLKDYAIKEGRVATGEVMLACRVKED